MPEQWGWTRPRGNQMTCDWYRFDAKRGRPPVVPKTCPSEMDLIGRIDGFNRHRGESPPLVPRITFLWLLPRANAPTRKASATPLTYLVQDR